MGSTSYRIAAFDIGKRNFAFVIGQVFDETHFIVEGFYLFDLVGERSSSIPVMDIYQQLYMVLQQFSEEWEHTNIILIEQQFAKKHRTNIQALKLSQHVLSYFLLQHQFSRKGKKRIIEYPSYLKTQLFDQSFSKKYDRKQWSVQYAHSWIQQCELQHQTQWLTEWFSEFKKKDDVADCLLMILSFLKKLQMNQKN